MFCFNSIVPPTVTTTNVKIYQYRGKDTTLECNIKVFPMEQIVWKKDNKVFKDGEMDWKYSLSLFKRSESEFLKSLQIFSLEPDDFGSYTCEATNEYGKASANVDLKGSLKQHCSFCYVAVNILIKRDFFHLTMFVKEANTDKCTSINCLLIVFRILK